MDEVTTIVDAVGGNEEWVPNVGSYIRRVLHLPATVPTPVERTIGNSEEKPG